MTFIFKTNATGPNIERRFSVGGKTREITKEDLLDFATRNGIRNANTIINRIAEVIKDFNRYADDTGIPQPWRAIIRKTLTDNLTEFGYLEKVNESEFCDNQGRTVLSSLPL